MQKAILSVSALHTIAAHSSLASDRFRGTSEAGVIWRAADEEIDWSVREPQTLKKLTYDDAPSVDLHPDNARGI